MRLKPTIFAALMFSALSTASAFADSFSFPSYFNPGQPASTFTLTAATSGEVTGFFVANGAGGEDVIRMYNATTGVYSPYILDNITTAPGDSASFGFANAGDQLVFQINNVSLDANSYYVVYQGGSPNPLMSTDPSQSMDGVVHAFAVSYPSGTLPGVGPFTYLGFEDLPASAADFDYDDVQIYVTNVTGAAAPEPATIALLGTGAAGLLEMLRRRKASV